MIHLDIDHLVEINDALGDAQGDRLLTELARRLRRHPLAGLRHLRRRGVSIAIDDSSLSYLEHLPVSALKIDRPFVRDPRSRRRIGPSWRPRRSSASDWGSRWWPRAWRPPSS